MFFPEYSQNWIGEHGHDSDINEKDAGRPATPPLTKIFEFYLNLVRQVRTPKKIGDCALR